MKEYNGNAALYFVDRHRAGCISTKQAFIEADDAHRDLTYGDLATQSDKMASLYAKHDIQREDRAILLLLDKIEFPVIFWGSLKSGIIPVPLNTLLSVNIYDAIFNDSRASVLFVSIELLPIIEPVIKSSPHLRSVFIVGEGSSTKYFSFEHELAVGEPIAMLDMSPDDTAFWLYSSGSTGAPKGVCHRHASLRATADTYGQHTLQITQPDIVFSAAKLFFAYGLGNSMTFPLAVGATAVLLSGRPTPQSVVDAIDGAEATLFCGVPTLYAALLAEFEHEFPASLSALRLCVSAGEALPAGIASRWTQLAKSEILDGVGSTEMLHIFLSNSPGNVVHGTSGIAVPGYSLRLIDENGAAVKEGEIGELLVKGSSAASSYWNKYDKSRETFEGVWTRTGDKYECSADGRFIYCGRTDDMFKVSGIWVSPFEVEQALVSHHTILEAAVVAVRDEDGLEKPKAFVVLKKGVESTNLTDQLIAHVKEKVGKWKYPRWIEITDELPKTATGKIQRFKLRE